MPQHLLGSAAAQGIEDAFVPGGDHHDQVGLGLDGGGPDRFDDVAVLLAGEKSVGCSTDARNGCSFFSDGFMA